MTACISHGVEDCRDCDEMATTYLRRHLRVLRQMANDYRHYAIGTESSENHKNAGRLWNRHHACLWALRELDPEIEGPRQIMADIAKARA